MAVGGEGALGGELECYAVQVLMALGCRGGLSPAVCGHELIQEPLYLWLLHLLWARHSQLGEQEP